MKTVDVIYVKVSHILCPHCGAEVDGWMGDPRGQIDTCVECDGDFKIDDDATVVPTSW
jgi:hypothetical protein